MAKKQQETIGQRIKAARERLGWTQEFLAYTVGVCVKTVSAWECDRSLPGILNRAALAVRLGVEC